MSSRLAALALTRPHWFTHLIRSHSRKNGGVDIVNRMLGLKNPRRIVEGLEFIATPVEATGGVTEQE